MDTAQTSSKMHGTMVVPESTVIWQTPALSLSIKPNEKCWLTSLRKRQIAGLEPVVTETLSSLVMQVDKTASSGTPLNIRRYLNYFTIDLFAELLYGTSLGCLKRGNDIVTAESPDGKVYRVPFVRSLHNATVINTALGMEASLLPVTKKLLAWHLYARSGTDYENIIYLNTKQRLRDPDAVNDIFSKLLQNGKGEDLNLSAGEILAECSVMMNAGTDTTTAALTNTIYLLYKHLHVLQKLREELEDATSSCDIPSYETVANLPFLRACIEEALRLRPASSMDLPRVVPEGGRAIAGEFVRAGVTVSVPTYALLEMPIRLRTPPPTILTGGWALVTRRR
jgi:cytochrome P450